MYPQGGHIDFGVDPVSVGFCLTLTCEAFGCTDTYLGQPKEIRFS